MSHAYLFFGERQIGKRLFAESFAYFLEHGSFEISSAPLLDARVFAPDEKGIIGIDAMRALRQFLSEKPFYSPKRFAIIDGAEALTLEAQSSLLKVVEEPPETSLIVFIARESSVLFAPLLSRLTKVYFKRFSRAEICNFLMELRAIPKKRAEAIAAHSFGRIGRALASVSEEANAGAENEEFEARVEKIIVDYYLQGAQKNAHILLRLLAKEEEIKRFNVNKNLQEKALTELLGAKGRYTSAAA